MISSKKLIFSVALYAIMCVLLALAVKPGEKPQVQAPKISADLPVATVQADQSFIEEPLLSEAPVAEKPVIRLPVVTAHAFLVGNIQSGEIYLERNSSLRLPVASMSKLITAFVATDIFNASTSFEITENAMKAPRDSSNMIQGDHFTLKEILFPLLLNSSNIVAEAIASKQDRAEFISEMNSYAWEVGMPNSFFADPSGVSPDNAATAKDIFGLATYLFNYRKDILAITRYQQTELATTTEHGKYRFSSTHPLINDVGFIGGKTGRTPEAGETMMTIMDIQNKTIAVIVMGSHYGARESDTRLLLQQLKKNSSKLKNISDD